MGFNKLRLHFNYLFLLVCFSVFMQILSGCCQAQSFDNSVNNINTAKITGCYSDLYFNEEGGDLLGIEIFIVYSRDGYYALYQECEGSPSVPQLLPVKVNGTAISFTVPTRGTYGEFSGKVTPNELTGTFLNTDNHISLKRKNSYWQ